MYVSHYERSYYPHRLFLRACDNILRRQNNNLKKGGFNPVLKCINFNDETQDARTKRMQEIFARRH